MRIHHPALLAAGIAVVGCGGPDTGTANAPGDLAGAAYPAGQWTALFDGAGVDAFQPVGDANWRIEDGWVGADSGNGYLVTRDSFADFDLRLEFWVDVPANSGVFLRCQDRSAPAAASCYEANIFDTRSDPTYRSGAIVDVAAPAATVHTGGRWNRYEITADGSRLSVALNGVPTVDVADDRFAAGPIALQYGAGRVLFRNVEIRPH